MMNKTVVSIALALALPLSAWALPEEPADVEGHHANRMEHLSKSLDLTAEQKTQVEALFNDERSKLKAIHDETQSRLQDILTKEQIVKLAEIKKQHHGKWKQKLEALKDRIAP